MPQSAFSRWRQPRGGMWGKAWGTARRVPKEEGVPAYALFRNAQLAEICKRRPRSLAALGQIEGVGEATCRKYGADLLALVPDEQGTPEGGVGSP